MRLNTKSRVSAPLLTTHLLDSVRMETPLFLEDLFSLRSCLAVQGSVSWNSCSLASACRWSSGQPPSGGATFHATICVDPCSVKPGGAELKWQCCMTRLVSHAFQDWSTQEQCGYHSDSRFRASRECHQRTAFLMRGLFKGPAHGSTSWSS